MTLTNLTGLIQFRVAGQEALPAWQRTAIRNALQQADAPPESLRFQCRIATDAKTNFQHIDLPDGTSLSLHPRSNPQFGKNVKGHAFLTATFVWSGDGQGYCLRWVGEAVPRRMQEVAVKHDEGKAVRAAVIHLDLAKASVTPSWKIHGHKGPSVATRKYEEEVARAEAKRRVTEKPKAKRSSRKCARLTAADLTA